MMFSKAAFTLGANSSTHPDKKQFLIDNLLVRTDLIFEMIWWTGLAPWECEVPFAGSLTSTFLLHTR